MASAHTHKALRTAWNLPYCFNEIDESELLFEVKTTGLGKYFPFYVTANELRCSEDMGPQFNLFRLNLLRVQVGNIGFRSGRAVV